MNVLTCQQVEEQLDLLAAGECDRPTRRAVEQHLETCAACSASYAESRRLQGLLDLHWNEADQLGRLRRRIDEADRESRRPRTLAMPWMRRAAALAAMLLVTFGLALLLPTMSDETPTIGLTVALAPLRGNGMKAEMMKSQVALAPAHDADAPPVATLTLKNKDARSVEVGLGGEQAQWKVEVQGPAAGVQRVPVPKEEVPALLPNETLRLAPGEQRSVPIKHFLDGSPRHLDVVYLTEPGEYTLTIRLRAVVGHELVWLTSEPLHIPVRAP